MPSFVAADKTIKHKTAGSVVIRIGIYFAILWVTSSLGMWLFYVQHTFPGARWRVDQTHASDPAVDSTSLIIMPKLMRWCFADAGYHSLHHYDPSIPNYRLEAALVSWNTTLNKVTPLQSLKNLDLAVWDESQQRFRRLAELAEK